MSKTKSFRATRVKITAKQAKGIAWMMSNVADDEHRLAVASRVAARTAKGTKAKRLQTRRLLHEGRASLAGALVKFFAARSKRGIVSWG